MYSYQPRRRRPGIETVASWSLTWKFFWLAFACHMIACFFAPPHGVPIWAVGNPLVALAAALYILAFFTGLIEAFVRALDEQN